MTEPTAEEPQKSSRGKSAAETRSPAEWAASKGTAPWALAGAMQAQRDRWVIGRSVSEDEYDAAIDRVVNLSFTSPARPARSKRGRR